MGDDSHSVEEEEEEEEELEGNYTSNTQFERANIPQNPFGFKHYAQDLDVSS